nr:vacuolar protein sorting-associated protein 26A [Tanacetum cinerariifolium]
MDLQIRRRESNTHVSTETLAKFELMDGAPFRGPLEAVSLISGYPGSRGRICLHFTSPVPCSGGIGYVDVDDSVDVEKWAGQAGLVDGLTHQCILSFA